MILYILFTLVCTVGLCVLAYRFFDRKIEQYQLTLDDGRGYYLISMLVIAFFGSSVAYFAGGLFGFDANLEQQQLLTAAILLNAVVALLALTYGLISFKEGEKYR